MKTPSKQHRKVKAWAMVHTHDMTIPSIGYNLAIFRSKIEADAIDVNYTDTKIIPITLLIPNRKMK